MTASRSTSRPEITTYDDSCGEKKLILEAEVNRKVLT